MEEKSLVEADGKDLQPAVSGSEAITISPELTVALGQAVASGISQGVLAVLASPELGRVIETVAKGKALSGMMEGLVSAEGRKGLDASCMKQNAIDMTHLIEAVFEKFKARAMEISTSEVSQEIVDGESTFREWMQSLDNDNKDK